MFARIVLPCAVAFALASGTPETSRASDPLGGTAVALLEHYDVYCWTPGHPETKRLHGSYPFFKDADHEAHHLQAKGFSTQIVHVH